MRMPGDGGLNYDTFYWVDVKDPANCERTVVTGKALYN